jgi:predicted hydrocarbon binding protein
MVKLFDMLKLARLVSMQDGEIRVMDEPVHILPSHILGDMQKDMIETLGFGEAYEKIYSSSKEGSYVYNKNFAKKYSMTDKRKLLEMQLKIVTSSGWGKLNIVHLEIPKSTLTIRFNNSPFPKEYGKQKYAVCIIPTAFTAGGVSVTFGKDVDAVETHCIARGDSYCEIKVGPPKEIMNIRKELWQKWGAE